MEISVIIPVYNISKYILECLKSVEKQKTEDCEIIIVDDGSTDESYEIIKNYISTRTQYKLLRQENAGLSAARNTGIKVAKGRYLLFLDGDDLLKDEALPKLESVIKNKDIDIVLNQYVKLDDSTGEIKEDNARFILKDIEPMAAYDKIVNKSDMWISAWNCVVSRKFIIQNKLYFEKGILHEDELWVPMIFMKARNVIVNNNVVHIYRINRDGSIMKTKNIKRELDKIRICNKLLSLTTDENKGIVYKRITNVMRSVLIESSMYETKADLLQIKEVFDKERKLLLNSKGVYLYILYGMLGFNNVINMIKLVRKFRG